MDVAVVVPSHDRPLRLRWLLNALEEQTLPRERFEVIVAHDSAGPETEELLRSHPLAAAGVLRHISFDPGPGPAVKRNAAWRATDAPVIAFTDDDCRPPRDWLERLLAAARRHPGEIVQGATLPDPDEAELMYAAPWARWQAIDPPTVWAETCNVAYPRELLERMGGFDERLPVASGEDTDLALRARAAGARQAAAPEAVTHHAVEAPWIGAQVRTSWRWQHVAYLVKHHPEVRRAVPLRVFWKRNHAEFAGLVAAAALARRHPAFALLALPWVRPLVTRYGKGPRGIARGISELPARVLVDGVEVAALARGSLRYRTVIL